MNNLKGPLLGFSLFVAVISCTTTHPSSSPSPERLKPQEEFFSSLKALCGKSFEGKLTSYNSADESWIRERKVMHVRDCSDEEIKIPLHVGENRSRTWIITRRSQGLRLKHDHRHEDGSPETVTLYGGETKDEGTTLRQAFPVDEETRAMFVRNKLEAAVANVWSLEINPGQSLAYGLTRGKRDFRIEFDLSKEVPTPPAVWGYP